MPSDKNFYYRRLALYLFQKKKGRYHFFLSRITLLIFILIIISYSIQVWASNPDSSSNTNSIYPQSCLAQLPLRLYPNDTGGLEQRIGDPVKLRLKRSFIIQTGDSHKSKNNIVAIYIGLPTPDPAHDNVVIEDISSEKANPENMIFSSKRDSLLVEYFDVHPGFKDEITITFSLDLYRRKANLSFSKERPYDRQSPEYVKYIKSVNAEPNQKLQKHLKQIRVDPKKSAITNARKIYHYLGKQLRYGHYASDETVPDDLLDGGKGHCGVYAAFFVAMCRESGIPARRCAGFLLGTDPSDVEQTTVSAHNWAEFYVEGIGWIPVDPIIGDKSDGRKRYYFGNLDNAHLCISKGGHHDQLPIWYKKNATGEITFTNNIDDFRPGFYPNTIQGAHRLQFRWDRPIQISVLNSYGEANMHVLSRKGAIQMPKK